MILIGGTVVVASTSGAKELEFEYPPGTDVMVFKIFSPKNLAKKLAFLTQNKAKF
jgi:hypothetical protein